MKSPIVMLPIEFFRRVKDPKGASEIYSKYSKDPIRLTKAIWLLASPTTGYAAPVDHSSYNKKKRYYPADQLNGLYYTWVGSTYETKCLIAFDPGITETSIPEASEDEVLTLYESLEIERFELTKSYQSKKMSLEPRVWSAFRQTSGNYKHCEYRQWLDIGEVCNLIFGPNYNIGARIANLRVKLIMNIGFVYSLCTYRDGSYRVYTNNLVRLHNLVKSTGEYNDLRDRRYLRP